MITRIWIAMVSSSFIFALFSGNMQQLSASAADGAGAAVQLCIGIGGVTCLWCGIMKLMDNSGVSSSVAGILRPLLKKLYPAAAESSETLDSIAKNVTANLLGIGNAATPAGIQAVTYMAERLGSGTASDEMCRLVIMNTASIQLIPTTVAAVRASAGAASPFDIIPAVWITSLVSCTVGLVCAKLLSKIC